MSGGIAYVYNPQGKFEQRVNREMVDLEEMEEADFEAVRDLIRNHFRYTSSKLALHLLNNWEEARWLFVKVMPKDYKAALQSQAILSKSAVPVAAHS